MGASKHPGLRLLHIRDEIDDIGASLRGVTFAQFQESFVLRRAVERAVQIVSEAAKSLPRELLTQHPDAPWNAIIGIGNILRHEYQSIDEARMWEIATVHFVQLRPVVEAMLAAVEDGDAG